VEVIALLLLPVAIAMCGYAIFIFIWRSQMIAKKRVSHRSAVLPPLHPLWSIVKHMGRCKTLCAHSGVPMKLCWVQLVQMLS
jgi:hypothetical protein